MKSAPPKVSSKALTQGAKRPLPLRILIAVVKDILFMIFGLAVSLSVSIAFFLFTPQIGLNGKQIRWLLDKGLPSTVRIEYSDFSIQLVRSSEGKYPWLRKKFSFDAKDFCAKYGADASTNCFDKIHLAGEVGWVHKVVPELISIEPLEMTGGRVLLDVPRLPTDKTSKNEKSSFDVLAFLRREILPKWKIQGSVIEVKSFKLRLSEDSDYFAALDLRSLQTGDVVTDLHEFRDERGPLRVKAQVRLLNPAIKGPFKILATSLIHISAKQSVDFKASASVLLDEQPGGKLLHSIVFETAAKLNGIPAVHEVLLDGTFTDPPIKGRVSVKIGAIGQEMKTLDLVKCGIDVDLDKTTAGVDCGPETIRMQLAEKSFLHNRKFFVLAPRFDLKVSNLDFGKVKKADFAVSLALDHMGILKLLADVKGHVAAEETPQKKTKLTYAADGQIHLGIDEFKRITQLLRDTPYSVPAPLNTLAGAVRLDLDAHADDQESKITTHLQTSLDSPDQAVHLRLNADTKIPGETFTPVTTASFFIDELRISAPRFDLRAPPAFKPDPRFGPVRDMAKRELADNHQIEIAPVKKVAAKKSGDSPIELDLHIVTTAPQAIKIATNLTKAPIPVDLNLVYAMHTAKKKAQKTDDDQTLESALATGVMAQPDKQKQSAAKMKDPSPISGSIVIGRTPVDLFKRNAIVDRMRIDLKSTGDNALDGKVTVSYLAYTIDMLITGLMSSPQIKFNSDPPLQDNQILAVLLFGHPLNELGDDQKASVTNMSAAFADAALSISSLYLLASTPIQSIGYDPERDLVLADMGLGGGATLEVGGSSDSSAVGIKKRLSRNFIFSSDVETVTASGQRTVMALVEWIKRF